MICEATAICKLIINDVLKSNLNKTHDIKYEDPKAAQRALLLEGKGKSNFYHWLKASFWSRYCFFFFWQCINCIQTRSPLFAVGSLYVQQSIIFT